MTIYPLVRLDEVAEVRLGRQRAPKNHTGDQMRPYLRAANVDWSGLKLDDVKEMNFTDAELAVYRLAKGDLLLSEASGSPGEVGKPALWADEIADCAFQNTLLRVRPREHDPRFLLHYFRYMALSGRFVGEARGVGINHLGRARLAGWLTPLPPLHEQLRIVEILEDHFSHLDAGKSYAVAASQRTEALRDATLTSRFAGVDGACTHLGAVAHWSSGGTPKAGVAAYYAGGDVPWCNSGDLKDGHIDRVPKSITQRGLAESAAKWVPAGSVLVAMYGATIGRVAINDVPMTTNQAVASARPIEGVLTSDYLFWFLRSQRRQLRGAGKGGAQPNISQSILKNWPIVLPSLAVQRAIAVEASNLDSDAIRLRTQIQQIETRSAALRRTVLAAAFEGRLTGRRTDDEVIEERASANRIREDMHS